MNMYIYIAFCCIELFAKWKISYNYSTLASPLVTNPLSSFFFLQVLYKHKIIIFGGFYDTLREVR